MVDYFALIPEQYFIPTFLIGTILEILVSGFVFRMSLKAVGVPITIFKALTFSLIIRLITLIINLFVPPLFFGLYIVMLNGLIWLLLIMKFFKIGIIRAILVAVIQAIITFVFIFIGIPNFIRSLKENV